MRIVSVLAAMALLLVGSGAARGEQCLSFGDSGGVVTVAGLAMPADDAGDMDKGRGR